MTDSDAAWDEYRRKLREGEISLKKYPTVLGEPIYIDPKQWPAEGDSTGKVRKLVPKAKKEYQKSIDRLITAKWNALFYLYGIEPTGPEAWEPLARALVVQHVPGFSVTNEPPKKRKDRGRPKKYDMWQDAVLINFIALHRQALKREKKTATVAAAVKRAVREGDLSVIGLDRTAKIESVVTRYFEAEKRWRENPFNKMVLSAGYHSSQSLALSYLQAVWQLNKEHGKS